MSAPDEHEILVAGGWERSPDRAPIRSPWSGEVAGTTFLATAAQIERAIAAAASTAREMRRLPGHARTGILRRTADALRADREALARGIALEAGKPLRDARTEVDRAVLTFETSAEEAHRVGGEVLPLDATPDATGRVGLTRRVAAGPVLAITPFNFPLNLVAHKLAPAVAAGCPVVLKPAPQTPLTALRLARHLERAGLPPGALSVLPLAPALHDALVLDDRFRVLSFTGSAAVGWSLKARAGRKRVLLELGGNAAVIVARDADLELAAARIVAGGYAFAGQTCISVQRCIAHHDVLAELRDRIVAGIGRLRLGDPLDEATDLGPLVEPRFVERTAAWVESAVRAGARLVHGGEPVGERAFAPTLLEDVPHGEPLWREEAFAPVVALEGFAELDRALASVEDSRFGLQAGIFTDSLATAWRAFEEIEAGAVLVNDVPSWRIDPMPYGGVKDSGLGREGPRWAIDEMTEPRLLVLRTR